MLNAENKRELAYVVTIDEIEPIVGRDRVESARVGGWTVMVRKGQFKPGDLGVYFEIDSRLPEKEPFLFLANKDFKVKCQKYALRNEAGEKVGSYWSQGLLMSADDFGGHYSDGTHISIWGKNFAKGDFLTSFLGVVYASNEDNIRKGTGTVDKYKDMARMHSKLFKNNRFVKSLYKTKLGKKILYLFLGHKKKEDKSFPTNLPYVKITDQERCENMPWVLKDKTPFIVTQKCDGSSGTYIVEKKKNKYIFSVYSRRHISQLDPDSDCSHNKNYYWECANKYNIKDKMIDYLKKNPNLTYLCWQGEVCCPKIQGNPQGLSGTHLFCFHMIDSEVGKYDIRTAKKIWDSYGMEVVPIVDENYILPDDFEAFKDSAEGFYDASVCEGKTNQKREGLVYYKTDDPNFSFKNVSREYLLKHQG